MKYLLKLSPFIILCALLSLLWRQLFFSHPFELPSALINTPLPAFNLPAIDNPYARLKHTEFKGGIKLLNFWATWCSACALEHETLMQISEAYHIPIYGILYKDDAEKARSLLRSKGNPYTLVGNDEDGNVAIDFGVYGTPETCIIGATGKILYRHIGALDEATWIKTLWPIIQKNS